MAFLTIMYISPRLRGLLIWSANSNPTYVWTGKGNYPLPFVLSSDKICTRETLLDVFKN